MRSEPADQQDDILTFNLPWDPYADQVDRTIEYRVEGPWTSAGSLSSLSSFSPSEVNLGEQFAALGAPFSRLALLYEDDSSESSDADSTEPQSANRSRILYNSSTPQPSAVSTRQRTEYSTNGVNEHFKKQLNGYLSRGPSNRSLQRPNEYSTQRPNEYSTRQGQTGPRQLYKPQQGYAESSQFQFPPESWV